MATTSDTPSSTRSMVLDSALALFQDHGFEKTTMREIAKTAGLSLGASYYYFRSKEELVLAFYQRTAADARRANPAILASTVDFKKRMYAIIRYKLDQLRPHRSLIKILAGQAADLDGPLSPFSATSKELRDDAIDLVAQAIEGSNLKVPKLLAPHVAKIFWLYQMGIIFYWANDISAEQKKTELLLDQSLTTLLRVFQVAALPGITPINRAAVKLIELIENCIVEKNVTAA